MWVRVGASGSPSPKSVTGPLQLGGSERFDSERPYKGYSQAMFLPPTASQDAIQGKEGKFPANAPSQQAFPAFHSPLQLRPSGGGGILFCIFPLPWGKGGGVYRQSFSSRCIPAVPGGGSGKPHFSKARRPSRDGQVFTAERI